MQKIYNTLTKSKEEFKPISPDKIGLYICGVTVYDYCHVGHARTFIAFDVIVRYLRHRGYNVDYVRNITDIDDKIIKKANEENIDCNAVTARFITAMHEDFAALNILTPDNEPKATNFMAQMIDLVKNLEEKGFAYKSSNGDVYYKVRKLESYGQLSGRKIEELESGKRVEVNDAKIDPLDFVLWKKSKKGEPSWDSPWGKGRPGWHLECSAMSTHFLGKTFDIHGGGFDLIFPHHENECAQSEAAFGQKFVNTWMHVGFLQINKEKMSKSLDNFFTIREVLKLYNPEVVRFFMLSGHYRSPIDYSEEQLNLAKSSLERLYIALRDVNIDKNSNTSFNKYEDKFQAAMDDDFNTPEAIAVLFELAKDINLAKTNKDLKHDGHSLEELGNILFKLASIIGVLQQEPIAFLQGDNPYEDPEKKVDVAEISKLINARNDARKQKNWQLADEIRNNLTAKGVILEDSVDGTTWRKL